MPPAAAVVASWSSSCRRRRLLLLQLPPSSSLALEATIDCSSKLTVASFSRAMPHIKTFTRYSGQKLAWFLLTSANLSKAAWGALQKNNSQLMICSYEDNSREQGSSQMRRTKFVTLVGMTSETADSSPEMIPLPVPYELPPQPYSSQDVPWSWDRKYSKKDVYGKVWPPLI